MAAVKVRSCLRSIALAAVAIAAAPLAYGTVAERVVAVVGEHAILLSDMRARARPFLLQIQQKVPPGAQQAAAESELYKHLLQRMVDERVEQQAAEKAHLTVTTDEIDNGLRNVAAQQGLTVDRLVEEAVKTGLSSQEYRDEVRRQILEGKLLQLRVRGRVRKQPTRGCSTTSGRASPTGSPGSSSGSPPARRPTPEPIEKISPSIWSPRRARVSTTTATA